MRATPASPKVSSSVPSALYRRRSIAVFSRYERMGSGKVTELAVRSLPSA
jgi:hypothetical protein